MTYGETDHFPAFYSSRSQFKVSVQHAKYTCPVFICINTESLASGQSGYCCRNLASVHPLPCLILSHRFFPDNQHQLGMSNGVLFGVPIPSQYHTVGDTIQKAVELAVKESEKNGMSRRGKEVTPWLLKRVNELTNGQSLPSSACPPGSCFLSSMLNRNRCCTDREYGPRWYGVVHNSKQSLYPSL